jgi:hypothetical protein
LADEVRPITLQMESLQIIGLGLLAAITYGIAHDQVTARVCVEYFTIGHPPLIPSESPTLLAIGWGIVATWWVGLPLGVIVATTARMGSRTKLTARQLRKPIATLLAVMATCALVSGIMGYALARSGQISLDGPMGVAVPSERHARFLADLWAHSASYASGVIGGVVLSVTTFRRRFTSSERS